MFKIREKRSLIYNITIIRPYSAKTVRLMALDLTYNAVLVARVPSLNFAEKGMTGSVRLCDVDLPSATPRPLLLQATSSKERGKDMKGADT